jgi:hypothetical protein
LDGDNQTLKAERYRIFKVILFVYLLGHLFTETGVTVNHFRHALFRHDARRPCLMQ